MKEIECEDKYILKAAIETQGFSGYDIICSMCEIAIADLKKFEPIFRLITKFILNC